MPKKSTQSTHLSESLITSGISCVLFHFKKYTKSTHFLKNRIAICLNPALLL